MLRNRFCSIAVSGAWIVAFQLTALAQPDLLPPGPVPAEARPAEEPGIETLTRGPIHEAFANPADMDPTPGPVVPKEPPPLVTEEPPEYMPEGAIWIPGYWVWDDDRDEFLWVTGVARVPPPGMQWVPGYFSDAEGGFQRVSGFWVSNETPEVEYRVQAPPQSLETGPSSPAPSQEHFWIPGSWNYYDTGYRWQAGYWAPYQPNWIWSPTRWVWTPGGYVHCPGFWDYRLAYRGQIFAPIYFQTPLYSQPNWVYRPWCVIPTNNLFIHLWMRPRWNCYYFGDYYGPGFANRGFVAWANLGVGRRDRYFYDPFHCYAQVHYRRQGINYLDRVHGWHRHFDEHDDLRPPRTWRDQQAAFGRDGKPRVETQLVARTVVDAARDQDAVLKIARLDEQAQRTQRQQAERQREFNQERSRLERTARQTAARLPDRSDRPGEGRDTDKGRDDAKTARDRDAPDRPGREPPKLTIPKDLAAKERSVVRTPAGGDSPGRSHNAPPRPRPSGRATASADEPGRDARYRDDRQTKGAAKSTDRDEPRRPVTAADQPLLPTRDSERGTERNVAGDDRRTKTGRDENAKRAETKAKSAPQVDRQRAKIEAPRIDAPGRRDDGGPERGNSRGDRNEGPRLSPPTGSPDTRSDPPRNTPLVPKGNAPTVRPEAPRNSPPPNRGKSESTGRDRSERVDASPGRTEALRPNVNRESPVIVPRVQSQPEARPTPRIEAPRESRPAPRIESPRPSSRVETPRPSGNVNRGGSSQPQTGRSDSDRSTSSSGDRGRSRSRDND